MDPIGPWYTSYNRLATTAGIANTFQTPTNVSTNSTHHLASTTVNLETVSSTTAPQLILQAAAHTTATLAGQPSPFNPGGFLSTPTAVGYDVYTPFFPHTNAKQTHYTTQNTQPIARAQVVSITKPNSPVEPDISSLRSSYASPQQNDAFFEHQTTSSPTTANWSLSHPTNTQLSSPFGILPHESVTVSSPPVPPATTTAPNVVTYDNPYVTHFNNNGTTVAGTDSKNSAWSNSDPIKKDDQSATNSPNVQPPLHHQSCIVSTTNITSSNRISQLPSRSPVPTTIYLTTDKQTISDNHNEHIGADQGHDSSQSSPVSFSIIDSRNINYSTNNASGKQQQSTNGTVVQQFHVLGQQAAQQSASCRHYSNSTDSEYHHPARSKSAASTDSAYSSNTSQNGPDCAVVVPRRPSPLQAHSQASPLGHVPSPATYPMYNSPMASMSSPSPLQQQAGSVQQMTPPSPLDVTVTRSPSQQNQVVYSSVITRALGANENNKTSYNTEASNRSSYERTQDFPQSKQMCWDNENRQQTTDQRKFPTASYMAPENAESNVLVNQQMQRILNPSDTQSSCLESGQISLQDLSSCRGDSMNIVKSLPTVQSNENTDDHDSDDLKDVEEERCQQVVAGAIGVKRKSLEKIVGDLTSTDYGNRIPPPAHHNAIVNQQQQQNGYIEFDRWNLTLPHTKLIAAVPATFSAQHHQQQQLTQLHHNTNLVANAVVAQQHHPVLVAQHPAPTISYFPTFHVAAASHHPGVLPQQQHSHHQTHPAHELHAPIEINTMGIPDNNLCQQNSVCAQNPMKDDRPQVIVPNIEEELGFLQQSDVTGPIANTQQLGNSESKRMSSNDPNSGFMTSYLKFLQGEKDSSPPPTRGGKKASWNNRKPYVSMESNGGDAWNRGGTAPVTAPPKSKNTPTIDYANDPRYFPLPKERKKQNFDSSDDGFSSDDDLPPLSVKQPEQKTTMAEGACQVSSQQVAITPVINRTVDGKPKKGRPIKPGGPTDRKRKAAAAAAEAAAAAAARGIVLPPVEMPIRKKANQLPRRESSRRKAKEKISDKQLLNNPPTADPYEVEEEQADSDSDPAWTPAAKSTGDEEDKRKKRGRPVMAKRKKFVDGTYPEQIVAPKRPGRKRRNPIDANIRSNAIKLSCKIDEKLLASVSDEDIDISPFKSGEFVVIKSDLDQEYPPLWRIDGKTLLQKYEPFQTNGRTLYRNISTYSGWAPQNRHIYQQVPVKFWQQGKLETIVEFLREDMILDDSECINKFMKETEKYQDNFEVYIQTLISQALDSNFLTEIFQEQDEYFLLNVKTVDEITEERKQRLLSTTNWQNNVVTALSTWPCINVLKDNISEYKGKCCAGCNRTKIHARVLLYGQPYNSTTLEGSPPDPQVPQEKDFLFCRICQTKVALFNKVAHQKYLMFLECARRVADKRLADPHKDTTIILNELLADEVWLNQLFREVRTIWAEIDSIQQQARKKAGFAVMNTEDNTSSSSVHILKVPGASELPIESQPISYNDQMSNCLS